MDMFDDLLDVVPWSGVNNRRMNNMRLMVWSDLVQYLSRPKAKPEEKKNSLVVKGWGLVI